MARLCRGWGVCFVPLASVWRSEAQTAREHGDSNQDDDVRPWLLLYMDQTTIFLLDHRLRPLVRLAPRHKNTHAHVHHTP
jgi:hypothetical protein